MMLLLINKSRCSCCCLEVQQSTGVCQRGWIGSTQCLASGSNHWYQNMGSPGSSSPAGVCSSLDNAVCLSFWLLFRNAWVSNTIKTEEVQRVLTVENTECLYSMDPWGEGWPLSYHWRESQVHSLLSLVFTWHRLLPWDDGDVLLWLSWLSLLKIQVLSQRGLS